MRRPPACPPCAALPACAKQPVCARRHARLSTSPPLDLPAACFPAPPDKRARRPTCSSAPSPCPSPCARRCCPSAQGPRARTYLFSYRPRPAPTLAPTDETLCADALRLKAHRSHLRPCAAQPRFPLRPRRLASFQLVMQRLGSMRRPGPPLLPLLSLLPPIAVRPTCVRACGCGLLTMVG